MMRTRISPVLTLVLLLAVLGCSREPAPAQSAAPGQAAASPAAGQPSTPAAQAGAPAEAVPAAGGPSAGTPGVDQPTAGAHPVATPPAAGAPPAGATPLGMAPAAPAAPAAAAAAAAAPRTFTLAEDRPLRVKTVTAVTTKTAQPGDTFRAFLTAPITDGDWTVAEEGAEVIGVVQQVDQSGRVKGRASLTVTLQSLQLADGSRVELRTSSYGVEAKSGAKKDAAKIGIGTAAGAGVGAIVGGKKGAAVGAVVGGGGATGVTLATRGDPAVIRAGAAITFRLREPVTVTGK